MIVCYVITVQTRFNFLRHEFLATTQFLVPRFIGDGIVHGSVQLQVFSRERLVECHFEEVPLCLIVVQAEHLLVLELVALGPLVERHQLEELVS